MVVAPIIVKAAVLLFVFCFAEGATGSCLSYGHSCWGAHGKRSGGGVVQVFEDGAASPGSGRWYLSRLVQPPRPESWRGPEPRAAARRHLQNESEPDVDTLKRPEERDELNIDSPLDEPDSDEVLLMEETPKSLGQKLRLYKIMKKNAEKFK